MPIELLTRKDLEEFKTQFFHELKNLLASIEQPIHKRILKSKDVISILRISPGNLQNLRKNETIRYTKIGGTIFYKYEDIEELLKNKRRA
ncbi:MAG TPA: helix-turn-helix domain-containing protein [Ginsengibacter sp.]